jgi:hypothetical protein
MCICLCCCCCLFVLCVVVVVVFCVVVVFIVGVEGLLKNSCLVLRFVCCFWCWEVMILYIYIYIELYNEGIRVGICVVPRQFFPEEMTPIVLNMILLHVDSREDVRRRRGHGSLFDVVGSCKNKNMIPHPTRGLEGQPHSTASLCDLVWAPQ